MVRKQKTAFIVLAIAGVFAFIFGGWQLLHNIKAPFQLKPSSFKLSSAGNSLADLQAKDTDKDGLTDYEELYIYETSPYLEDSDSDIATDYEEVSVGADPNCPTGQVCAAVAKTTEAAPALPGMELASSAASSSAVSSDDAAAFSELTKLGNLSADELRAMLKEAGMGEDLLNQMDDTTLMDLYKKALTSTQAQ